MIVYRHRKRAGSYQLLILTNPELTDATNPDPSYLREFTFGPKHDSKMTEAEYVQMQLREAKALIEHDAAQLTNALGSKVASEGSEL